MGRLLEGDGGVVLQVDFGVEATGEQTLVMRDDVLEDPDVVEAQAGQGREVGVGLLVEPHGDDVDELDGTLLAGAGLEELLFAGADGSVLQLALDNLQALRDLLLIGASAVATEEELAHVGGDGVLTLELADQVLPDDVTRERLGREGVDAVHGDGVSHERPPWFASSSPFSYGGGALQQDAVVGVEQHQEGGGAQAVVVGHDQ